MIQIEVDTHTHTVLSGHGWSTLKENIEGAVSRKLKGICLTEHAPAMPGSCPDFVGGTSKILPESDRGVHIIMGSEYNIMNFDGVIDITNPRYLAYIQFGIASLHEVVIQPGRADEHTQAFIQALQNPYVDIVGHPGNPAFPCHIEEVVLAAKNANKMVEINNNSFRSRKGCKENCYQFAKYCKQHDVRICVSSDAHYYQSVGVFDEAIAMLEELRFPQELILNGRYETFKAYLDERTKRISA